MVFIKACMSIAVVGGAVFIVSMVGTAIMAAAVKSILD